MGMIEWAERELKLAGYDDPNDEFTVLMRGHVLSLLHTFCDQGHSGGSAPIAAAIFNKLAQYEPLTPLQGTPDEWNEVGEDMFQNNRCGRVFWNKKTGRIYDIDGVVFKRPDGVYYTNSESVKDITFPYTPETEIRLVPDSED